MFTCIKYNLLIDQYFMIILMYTIFSTIIYDFVKKIIVTLKIRESKNPLTTDSTVICVQLLQLTCDFFKEILSVWYTTK